MKDARYNVILAKTPPERPMSNDTIMAFAQLFGIGEQQAMRLFAQAPLPLKKEIDWVTAKKFVHALRRIEVEVTVTRYQMPDTGPFTAVPLPADYTFTLTGTPHAAFLTIQVPAGKAIKTEASVMVTVSDNLRMATQIDGGFGLRLAEDTLFLNEFHTAQVAGSIGIAPALPGDVVHIHLDQDEILYLCSRSYLASSQELELEKAQSPICVPQDMLHCRGPGDLWFSSAGAVLAMKVQQGLYVCPDKLIAWSGELNCQGPTPRNHNTDTEETGHSLCHLTGVGQIWLQTCSENTIARWCEGLSQITDE